jgi:serine/threonine protein phosphatase PrpC
MAGTTAVGGVVLGSKENGRKVVMANAGDSRAIIAYEDNGRLKV